MPTRKSPSPAAEAETAAGGTERGVKAIHHRAKRKNIPPAYRAAWRGKMEEVNACIEAHAEVEKLVDQPLPAPSFDALSGFESLRFARPTRLPAQAPWRVGVKVIDPRGNEGLRVITMASA